jgi:hypothetical protein
VKNDEKLIVVCPLDNLFTCCREGRILSRAIIGAIAAFSVAVIPLIASGQAWRILNVPYALGFFGFIWVLTSTRSVTIKYRGMLEAVAAVVVPDQQEYYKKVMHEHLRKLSDHRHCFKWCSMLWVFAALLMAANWYRILSGKYLEFFVFMPSDWYHPPGLLPRYISLATLFVPIVILTYIPGRLIVLHTHFVHRLNKIKFLPSANACAYYLRDLMTVGVVASFTWSVGVGLFAFLFKDKMTLLHIAFLVMLGMIGTSAFVIPFLEIRELLLGIARDRNSELLHRIREMLQGKSSQSADFLKIAEYEGGIIGGSKVNELLFGWRIFGTLMASIVIPLLSSLAQSHILEFLKPAGSP